MREILFRGKSLRNEWVYGGYVGICNGGKIAELTVIHIIEKCDNELVKTETVGQFTGLTDKNGKKIFEGDIVKIHRKYLNAGCEEDCLYEVIWHKHWCCWALRNLKPTQCCYLSDVKDGEVIGNIHDNPELLGE